MHSWEGIWGNWVPLGGGGRIQTAPATVLNADGRGEVFATGSDGQLWHVWQPAWQQWIPLSHPPGLGFIGQPAAIRNTDGRLEVFARATDHSYWHSWQLTPGGAWSGWDPLGGQLDSDPTVALNQDGHPEVFGLAPNAGAYHTWYVPGRGWSGWAQFSGAGKSKLAAAQNADGRIEIFLVGTDNQMYHSWQLAPNGGWFGWSSLPGAPGGGWLGDPSAVLDPSGVLAVFGWGSDTSIWLAAQPSWSWRSFGGQLTTSPVAAAQSAAVSVWYQGTDASTYESYRGSDQNWQYHLNRGNVGPPGQVQMGIPYWPQTHPLSCEAAATRMALAAEGIYPGENGILGSMNPSYRAAWYDGNGMRWDDPYARFVGDPNGRESNNTGYGTYWPVAVAAAQVYSGRPIEAGEGISTDDVYWAVRNTHPVVTWIAYHGGGNAYGNYQPLAPRSYLADDGRWVLYGQGYEHAVTVIGVSPNDVLINNPWNSAGQVWLPKSVFENSYGAFNHMAVVFD